MQSFILNFQRWEGAFHQCQAWVKLQLVLYLLLLTVLQLYHLSPPLPPPVSNSSGLFTWCQALYANHCTIVHFFSRYCKIENDFLIFLYYLCERNYKLIMIQHYIANCVSWLTRLTLLDLWTDCAYEQAVRMKPICM